MKAAPASGVEGNDFVFYGLYQSLPVGAAFVDSERKVFAANRKMRAYFPLLSGGQQGLPICEAVRCPQFWEGNGPCGRPCENCVLLRGLETILCDGKPMKEARWRYCRLCRGAAPSRGGAPRRLVRWFRVSGNPVAFFGRRYAALFFGDITEPVLRERLLREKLKLAQRTRARDKGGLLRSLDALLRAKGRGPVSVCMVDFDDFKAVNDRYGHLTGDRVLETFCDIARRDIRSGDVLGRFGGEEFLLVLRADREQAVAILRRIQFDLRKAFFGVLTPPVTFSAGVACEEGASYGEGAPRGGKRCGWEELVEEADRLMYRAKAAGKSRIAACRRQAPPHAVS